MKALGFEKIDFDHSQAKGLNPPEKAVYAELTLEAGNDDKVAARFLEIENTLATANDGMPLNDLTVLEVRGANLQNFSVIGIEIGTQHSLKVQYFG